MAAVVQSSLPQGSFVSCLDYGREGSGASAAAPAGISSSTGLRNVNPDPSSSSLAGATSTAIKGRNSAATFIKPMARASKAAALQLIKRVDGLSGADGEDDDPLVPNANRNPVRVAQRLPNAPALNFSTIRTAAPRHPNPLPRPADKPRIFGLEHCPVYHPTIEEFARPMEYIEKISVEAREYGICKVVPPEGWRPPFALDTEVCSLFLHQ